MTTAGQSTYLVPRWRMPFPTLPTLTGKRPASRRARREAIQWLKTQRFLASRPGRGVMAEYRRLMSLTPEQAARDGLDD